MPSITYHAVLQKVLSTFAKAGKRVIVYQDAVHRICGLFIASSIVLGPRRAHFIMKAVKREIRARRLSLDTSGDVHLIEFTTSGLKYYEDWGTFPLYHAEHPSLRYLTIRRLRSYSKSLRLITGDIQDVFRQFDYPHEQIHDLNNLPRLVRTLHDELELLETENDSLHLELHNQESYQQRLLQPEV